MKYFNFKSYQMYKNVVEVVGSWTKHLVRFRFLSYSAITHNNFVRLIVTDNTTFYSARNVIMHIIRMPPRMSLEDRHSFFFILLLNLYTRFDQQTSFLLSWYKCSVCYASGNVLILFHTKTISKATKRKVMTMKEME